VAAIVEKHRFIYIRRKKCLRGSESERELLLGESAGMKLRRGEKGDDAPRGKRSW